MKNHQRVERYFEEFPQETPAALAEWLQSQSQQVWAQVIRGLDRFDDRPEALVLQWMVGRRELDRSNAVRLFWALFDGEVWAGARENARLRDALCRLVERFEAGFYTVQALELARGEARYFHRLRRNLERRASYEGWPSEKVAFEIPAAFTRQMPGLSVLDRPAVRPEHNLTGALRRSAEALGAEVLALAPEVMARRRREARQGWLMTRAAETVALGAFAAAGVLGWMFWNSDMQQMLAMVGY